MKCHTRWNPFSSSVNTTQAFRHGPYDVAELRRGHVIFSFFRKRVVPSSEPDDKRTRRRMLAMIFQSSRFRAWIAISESSSSEDSRMA
jgi:hypothetical protein